MTNTRTTLAVFGVGLLGLSACQSPGGDGAPTTDINEPIAATEPTIEEVGFEVGATQAAATTVAMPLYLEQEFDSTIGYLLAAYDANGDATISRDEYSRGDSTWDRLDKNKDGAINEADFVRREGGGGSDRMRTFVAQRMIGKYFQADDEVEKVYLDEVQASFAAYDSDNNDVVAIDEFTCAFEQAEKTLPGDDMYGRMIGDIDPWEAILAGADEDKDGALALAELEAFFTARASGDENIWTFEAPQGRSGGHSRTASDGPREESQDGAMEGARAPDFTLSSPDGLDTVTLSSFAGDKPVALIFGSYT